MGETNSFLLSLRIVVDSLFIRLFINKYRVNQPAHNLHHFHQQINFTDAICEISGLINRQAMHDKPPQVRAFL